MTKLKLLGLMTLAFIIGACQSEIDQELEQANLDVNASAKVSFGATTRSGEVSPFSIVSGTKAGVYVECDGQLRGPLSYTLNTNLTGFIESMPIIDNTSRHQAYAYWPYAVNASTDPTNVTAQPVPATQTQTSATVVSANYEFYVAGSTGYYYDQNANFTFSNTYSYLEFRFNTNVNGLAVKSIEVKAPNSKIINFTSARFDVTSKLTDSDFAIPYDVRGGTSQTVLNISDGLSVPNSTSDYVSAYMTVLPFDCTGEKLTVTITTTDGQTFTFQENGINYTRAQTFPITYQLEGKKQCTPKNIRVLSVCEVGCLGTRDNTKQWNCYYGALNNSAKEIRKLLHNYFGKGKLVETGVISFEKIDIMCLLNKVSDCYLEQFDIIYLNYNARPSTQTACRIMKWLNGSKHRVLMLAYDWKTACLNPCTRESLVPGYAATNYLIFKNHITGVKPHWYNGSCNYSVGNYGHARSGMLVPFELNARTSYFWKDGPFKTNLTECSDQRYWIDDYIWGSAEVTDPNVIPLISYRNAKDDCIQTRTHKYGCGDNGMILGVDPTKRIVYVGDSEIFSTVCVPSRLKHARMASTTSACKPADLNNYSKIMGNLWAWMIQEVIQKP